MSRLNKYIGFAVVGVAAMSTTLSAAPAPSKWLSTVTVTSTGSHIPGNPAAKNKVVEYLSYTCGHCADFEMNHSPAFKTQFVATGKASLEIRNMLLNPIDLTAAMLARCGGKDRFFGNQKHLFATQATWLGKAKNISAATQAHLKTENYTAYMTGVYNEIGLGPIMQQRGITPVQAKACLADKAALKTVLDLTDGGAAAGVTGTPTFMINGVLQDHVHSFADLKAKMK